MIHYAILRSEFENIIHLTDTFLSVYIYILIIMDRIIFQLLSLPHICKNDKQIKAIINSLTRKQKYKIQRFIKNILNGKIPLNDAEYRKLSKHKTFIRNLKGGKVNVKSLLRNYNIFSEIINVMLTNSKNESNEKNDFGSF